MKIITKEIKYRNDKNDCVISNLSNLFNTEHFDKAKTGNSTFQAFENFFVMDWTEGTMCLNPICIKCYKGKDGYPSKISSETYKEFFKRDIDSDNIYCFLISVIGQTGFHRISVLSFYDSFIVVDSNISRTSYLKSFRELKEYFDNAGGVNAFEILIDLNTFNPKSFTFEECLHLFEIEYDEKSTEEIIQSPN